MRFETYEEAAAYAAGRSNMECRFENFRDAINEIGNPQNSVPCVHVAGTNGKGSTCRYLYDILKTEYTSVALYTSPHLVDVRDRIRIDDEWIPKEQFTEYMNEILPLVEKYSLSQVAIYTMMFFLWCQKKKPDIAVVEVSLGGRWDTTNVIASPLCSVITTIDYDHMHCLGNTIELIAGEKAGIIKYGCPVLLGNVRREAQSVIRECAAAMHAEVHESLPYEDSPDGVWIRDRFFPVSGSGYQRMDAVFALSAADLIGIDIFSESVMEAVRGSFWPGRFETVSLNPRIILDGSHNEEGIRALIQEIPNLPRPVIAVFAVLADKQGKKMAAMLREAADELIVTEFRHARADRADHVASSDDLVVNDYRRAIETAVSHAGNGTVLITGSLYFIARVRRELKIEDKTTENCI